MSEVLCKWTMRIVLSFHRLSELFLNYLCLTRCVEVVANGSYRLKVMCGCAKVVYIE